MVKIVLNTPRTVVFLPEFASVRLHDKERVIDLSLGNLRVASYDRLHDRAQSVVRSDEILNSSDSVALLRSELAAAFEVERVPVTKSRELTANNGVE